MVDAKLVQSNIILFLNTMHKNNKKKNLQNWVASQQALVLRH
jgi:hypothetical protein